MCILNIAEFNKIKTRSSRIEECLTIYDGAADSSFISTNLASKLGDHPKKRVILHLQTIPDEKDFETFQHEVMIQIGGAYRRFFCYECSAIGQLNQVPEVEAIITEAIQIDIKIPHGPVDLLIGLKQFSLHPVAVQPPLVLPSHLSEVRVLKSVTTNQHLLGGAISGTFIRELQGELQGGQQHKEVDKVFFTISELAEILSKERDLDVIPLQCESCQERSKNCIRCKMTRKPISIQSQKERKMIKEALRFDPERRLIETTYFPTESNFNEIFPPSLSNEKEAAAISRKVFRRMKSSGQLEAFQEAFQKYLDLGYMRILTKEEMAKWEEKKLCISYCSVHGVPKEVSDGSKQSMRLVLNSSLRRRCFLRGRITTSSLNSLLPVGKSDITSLVDILIQWSTKKYSLIYDLVKAYNNIVAGMDEESQKMLHLRRFVWYVGEKDKEEEVTAACTTVWYGDSCASSILEEVKIKISEILEKQGMIEASKTTISSSYIDDTAKSFDEKERAFEIFEQCEKAMAQYSIQIHSPTISSREGKFDDLKSEPRTTPVEGEPERIKFFGLEYSPFRDEVTIKIQKKLNTKGHRGMREMADLTLDDLEKEDITMRKFCSWTHSMWDPCGKITPVTCQGKLVLAHIQAALPPTSAENWDKKLEGELEQEAKEYMRMILRLPDFTWSRSPPSGVLEEIHIHHDAGAELVATGAWAIYVTEDGRRASKHLYSRAHIGKRSIPDMELNSALFASSLALNLLSILENVKRVRFFGDSSSTQTQLCSVNKAKDVFSKNRISKITSNTKSIQDLNVDVNFNLVASENNNIDKATKKHSDAVEYSKSSSWLVGPPWSALPEEQWPVTQVLRLKADLFEIERGLVNEEYDSRLDECSGEKKNQRENTFTAKVLEHDDADGGVKDNKEDDGDVDEVATVPIFSSLILRVSVPRIAVRVVARLSRMFKEKSFKAIKSEPTMIEEEKAWLLLARDQQGEISEKDQSQSGLLPFKINGCSFTRQRWTQKTHRDIYNCDQLPILTASSPLGQLLLKNAHRNPGGPCRSDIHATIQVKLSKMPAYLTGNVAASLVKIRKSCVSCRKKTMAIKGNNDTVFCPKMCEDRFKEAQASPWSKISVDLIAPVKTFDRPERVTRARPRPRYAKKAILVVADCSGVAAVRFVLMADQSAASFCTALQQHIVMSGKTPETCYADMGSIFVATSLKEKEKKTVDVVDYDNARGETDEGDSSDTLPDIEFEEVKRRVGKLYPTIHFEIATSGSQRKNSISEEKVKCFKLFVRNILCLKPNASIPALNNEHLNLLLSLAAYHLNSRPIGFIKPNTYLCANHFILPNFDCQNWEADETISSKFKNPQEYLERMHSEYVKLLQSGTFLATIWKTEGLLPQINDIVFISRGANKVSKLGCLEYARIIEVSQDKRLVKAIVCRTKSGDIKEVDVDSRNCRLIYRPDKNDDNNM